MAGPEPDLVGWGDFLGSALANLLGLCDRKGLHGMRGLLELVVGGANAPGGIRFPNTLSVENKQYFADGELGCCVFVDEGP